MMYRICSQVSGPGRDVHGKLHSFIEADLGNPGLTLGLPEISPE